MKNTVLLPAIERCLISDGNKTNQLANVTPVRLQTGSESSLDRFMDLLELALRGGCDSAGERTGVIERKREW